MGACGLGPDNKKLLSRFMILIEATLQRCRLDSLETIPSKSDIEFSVHGVRGSVLCRLLLGLPASLCGHFLNTVECLPVTRARTLPSAHRREAGQLCKIFLLSSGHNYRLGAQAQVIDILNSKTQHFDKHCSIAGVNILFLERD